MTYEEWAATADKRKVPLDHEASEHGFSEMVIYADGSWIGCMWDHFNVIVECHDAMFDTLGEAQDDLWENYAKHNNKV